MTTMETYYGHIRTQLDAILLFEACRIGYLPRINRRLSERERLRIRSGSIFIWDEREASMRRWTDGKSWSASRVSGSFLIYKEMDPNHHNHSTYRRPSNSSDSDESATARKRKHSADEGCVNSSGEEDNGSNANVPYKPEGLIKQSFSITTSTDRKLHLIAYYHPSDINTNYLIQPSLDPKLKDIQIPLDMYPDTSFSGTRLIPAVTLVSLDATPYHHHPYYRNPTNPFQPQRDYSSQPGNHNTPGNLPMGMTHPSSAAVSQTGTPQTYNTIPISANSDRAHTGYPSSVIPSDYHSIQRPSYHFSPRAAPPGLRSGSYGEYIPSMESNEPTSRSLSVSTTLTSASSSTVTSATSTISQSQEPEFGLSRNPSLVSLFSVKQQISLPSPVSQSSLSSVSSSPRELEREAKRPYLANNVKRVVSPLPRGVPSSLSTLPSSEYSTRCAVTPPPPSSVSAVPSQSILRATQSATSLPILSK